MIEPNVDKKFYTDNVEHDEEEICEIVVEHTETRTKFQLCVLRTQQGKTFVAISRIRRELDQAHMESKGCEGIHVIFTMNTLLNNKQFSKRLHGIEETYGKGSVCIFASKYDGEYTHVKSVSKLNCLCAGFDTKQVCPKVIVICSNKKRFQDGVDFLTLINNNIKEVFPFKKAFVYYDELHEYINPKLRSQIREIHDLEIVKCITGLTATPDKIFEKDSKFWSNIRIIKLDDYIHTDYAGFDDMVGNIVDDYFETPYKMPGLFDYALKNSQTLGFIEHVIDNNPTILQDDTRTFIPAHVTRESHNNVRDLVFERNKQAVVVVVNGVEKTLTYYDTFHRKKTLSLNSRDKELSETMSELIIEYKLESRPIIITGFLCVGMGQTLSHISLGSFTSAIFGHLDLTNDELYQLFGRITGRMKSWEKYTRTQVYFPTITRDRIAAWEMCSKNMASEENGGAIFCQEDYRKPLEALGCEGTSAIGNIRKEKKTQSEIQSSKAKKELKHVSMRVPVIINGLNEDDLIFTSKEDMKNGEGEKKNYVISLLKDMSQHDGLYNFVTNPSVKCVQITRSTSGKSYKKHITDVVEAAASNKQFIVDGRKEHKDINNWQVFVDRKERRICIVTWVVDSSLY